MMGLSSADFMKGAAYAVETLTDPKTSHSQEPEDSPLARGFGKRMALFDWYDLPENAFRRRRFGNAMRSLQWHASILSTS